MASQDGRLRIETAFAAAPLHDDGWIAALGTLARETGSDRAQLISLGERALDFNWITDPPPGYVEDFMAIGAYRADVNWRIAAAGHTMEIVHEHHYRVVQANRGWDAYEDHVARFEAPHGCQTTLADDDGVFLGLALLRSARTGATNDDDRAVFAHAAPLARSAVRLQHAIDHQGALLLAGGLDAVRTAAFVLDRTGRVIAHTLAADRLLGQGAIRLRGGRLSAAMRGEDAALQNCIAQADRGTNLWLTHPGSGERMLAQSHRLAAREHAFRTAPAALLTLRTPGRGADAALLATRFDLTAAEADIAAMLAGGMSRAAIAATRGTSPGTLASQMKSIYRKCEVQREGELMIRLLAV